MITAERQIDDCLLQYDADGTLTIVRRDMRPVELDAHTLYCLLAFVRLENIAQRAARHERERQRAEWEARD